MAVTESQQTSDSFEWDEHGDVKFYEGGTFGLHLGVLRRFAAMAAGEPPRSIRSDVN